MGEARMEMPALNDMEDRTLAMADGEYIHFRIARPVLGTYYERDVSFDELTSIVGRLANLGLIRWRIRTKRCWHFRERAAAPLQHSCAASFTASNKGQEYLRGPRSVR